MRFSRAVGYALYALVFMSRRSGGEPVASHTIAAAGELPTGFLLKALLRLEQARILHSLRGPHGGYRLARPLRSVSLLEVVEAVDGPVRAEVLPVGSDIGLDTRLQGVCNRAAELVRERLRKVSVADLASKGK